MILFYSSLSSSNTRYFWPLHLASPHYPTINSCPNSIPGWLRDFVCWRGWVVFTRIAFALYLAQFPVFFYNVGSNRYVQFYSIHSLVSIDVSTVPLNHHVTHVSLPFLSRHFIWTFSSTLVSLPSSWWSPSSSPSRSRCRSRSSGRPTIKIRRVRLRNSLISVLRITPEFFKNLIDLIPSFVVSFQEQRT